jgi:hypothetical protein
MKKNLILTLLILMTCISTFASTVQCDAETPLNWILNEADSNHPRILLERLNLEKVAANEAEAGKRINPELEHFSVWGKEFGAVNVYMNESRLWFTLQLANKRQKKLTEWARDLDMAKHDEVMLRQSLLKDLWLNFFRIHQINEEIELKNILIGQLNTILNQYKKRKFLSPDQSLEERIFTMVVDNLTLTLSQLNRERLTILSFFREITGYKCHITKIALEANHIKWPSLDSIKKLNESDYLQIQKVQHELDLNLAQVNVANAKGTPDLRLTPVIQSFGDKDVFHSAYGLAFVLPLAIFDRNQSDRAKTLLTQKYTEKRLEITKSKEEHFFDFKMQEYKNSLVVLNEVEVIDASLKRFKNVSQAYIEGKLSISNIVEFCRQLDEIQHRYHQGESILMTTLMELYSQRGKLDHKMLENLL